MNQRWNKYDLMAEQRFQDKFYSTAISALLSGALIIGIGYYAHEHKDDGKLKKDNPSLTTNHLEKIVRGIK